MISHFEMIEEWYILNKHHGALFVLSDGWSKMINPSTIVLIQQLDIVNAA